MVTPLPLRSATPAISAASAQPGRGRRPGHGKSRPLGTGDRGPTEVGRPQTPRSFAEPVLPQDDPGRLRPGRRRLRRACPPPPRFRECRRPARAVQPDRVRAPCRHACATELTRNSRCGRAWHCRPEGPASACGSLCLSSAHSRRLRSRRREISGKRPPRRNPVSGQLRGEATRATRGIVEPVLRTEASAAGFRFAKRDHE